jgi:hypothetical protein
VSHDYRNSHLDGCHCEECLPDYDLGPWRPNYRPVPSLRLWLRYPFRCSMLWLTKGRWPR